NENKFAQYNLGVCYQYGNDFEKDEIKTFEWLKKSAEQNYKHTQNKLGEDGTGTEKDLKKAIYWYQKAAENGDKYALYSLGLCYQYGNGVEKDEIKAFEFFQESNEKENISTQFETDIGNVNNIETVIDRLIMLLIKMQNEKGYNFME